MLPTKVLHQCIVPINFCRRREMAKKRSTLVSAIRTATEGAREER